jgi:hypothetical protein
MNDTLNNIDDRVSAETSEYDREKKAKLEADLASAKYEATSNPILKAYYGFTKGYAQTVASMENVGLADEY